MKTVYVCFCTDIIHEGHWNIIREAEKYGRIIAGILSDEAMVCYDRFPLISFQERRKLFEDIPQISKVIIQKEVMYHNILEELKPDYVIHGDNWREGPLSEIRKDVIDTLESWGGELIEIPYTYNEEVGK